MDYFAVWSTAVHQEIDLLSAGSKGVGLYRLVTAIVRSIQSAKLDDVLGGKALYGTDKTVLQNTALDKKQKLVAAGATELRDVTGFAKTALLDVYWSIGVNIPTLDVQIWEAESTQALLQLHADAINEEIAVDLTGIAVVWIAICPLSDRAWLFDAAIGMCIDNICRHLENEILSRSSVVIDAVKNLGGGEIVCALIDNRTPVGLF